MSRLPALGGLALLLALFGCPKAERAPSPPPPSAAADLQTARSEVAAAPVEPEPRSLELGLLRQSVPRLPGQGAVYAVPEFPQHTPPLQDGTEDDRRLVEVYCVGCHSTTYISMQPPLPHERWEAEVKKMINAYGAVVPDPIAVRIATYLHSYYGNSPLPPRRRSGVPGAPSDGAANQGLGDP